MKFSSRFSLRKWLTGALSILAFAAIGHADDQIVLKDGRTQNVTITGVTGTSVIVKVGTGTAGIPFASIARVSMTPPADFTAGMKAFAAKDYPKAVATLTVVTSQYRGLPAPWVQEGMTTIGAAYLALNDVKNAEAAYNALQKAYPGQAGLLVNVGMARIEFAKKNYDAAKQKLEPISAKALKEKTVTSDLASAYSQTFCLLGEIDEAQGNTVSALENYLRTVTIFDKDSVALNTAQERSDALKKQNVVVP